ncbi:hypothetical protein BR93DRAFT_179619 [Coniochaeta sp. PMI_546]|nr:hypothetical protein BR93DRAFT_179619 [Coniochaeta sp. PMI_546]
MFSSSGWCISLPRRSSSLASEWNLLKQGCLAAIIRYLFCLANQQFADARAGVMHPVADDLASPRCSLRQRLEYSPVYCCILTRAVGLSTSRQSRGSKGSLLDAPSYGVTTDALTTRISLLASRPQITGRGRPPSPMPYMRPNHTHSENTLISPPP